jgi:fluoride exporter
VLAYLWIAIGSALGGAARYGASAWALRTLGPAFPWGTLAVNVAGSLAIGLTAALTGPGGRWSAPDEVRLFIMVGFCGGFTTFSAFSLQTLELVRRGDLAAAAANVAVSVAACLIAVWAGFALGGGLRAQ